MSVKTIWKSMYVVEKYVTNNKKKNYKMETFSPETFFFGKNQWKMIHQIWRNWK